MSSHTATPHDVLQSSSPLSWAPEGLNHRALHNHVLQKKLNGCWEASGFPGGPCSAFDPNPRVAFRRLLDTLRYSAACNETSNVEKPRWSRLCVNRCSGKYTSLETFDDSL
jgi:hypothetical protein